MRLPLLITIGLSACLNSIAIGQIDYDRAPINYSSVEPTDSVARLQLAIKSGEVTLQRDAKFGLLPSLLKHLKITPDSQTLVFSKTSFQIRKISPSRPRAIYFNDDVYVGWVQNSEVIEIASTDPQNGAMFWTVEPSKGFKQTILRDTGQCLACHANNRTQGVPGFVMRSIYPSKTGQFVSGAPSFTVNHNSKFSERWGGWYVTGTHGKIRHLGNTVCDDKHDFQSLNLQAGANVESLSDFIDPGKYLRPTSDIVALLLLEHQTQMHNLIIRASFETRSALHHDATMNKILERPKDHVSDTTRRRIAKASEKLLRYMLFADAPPYDDSVRGNPSFHNAFVALGPFDSAGGSMRELDLETRLLKHPISYLIFSEAFERLPKPVKEHLGQRLFEILVRQNDSDFPSMTNSIRSDLISLLRETKTDFWADYVHQ